MYTYLPTYLHTYILIHIQTHIHTYTHAYTHRHTCTHSKCSAGSHTIWTFYPSHSLYGIPQSSLVKLMAMKRKYVNCGIAVAIIAAAKIAVAQQCMRRGRIDCFQ